MKPSNLQAFKAKAKLTLKLPTIRTKTQIHTFLQSNKPQETSSSSSNKSSETLETAKNTFLQKYTIGNILGQGAHGVVKQCTLKSKQQKYAVKITKLDQEISFLYRKNFLTMKCLNHQNIIKYKALYLDQVKRVSYLVMDLIPYPTLKCYKVQNEQQLKQIAFQIVKALHYMHKKHICHRDLKSQNILYSKKDKKLKIIDFGICKKMTLRQQKIDMLTPTGTLAYKAPQMFQGGGYDEKIDIWALGVIMYELVTGKNPFISEYMADTIKNIQTLQVSFEQDQWKDYSKICKDLISHLLIKNKNERLSIDQTKSHLFFRNIQGNIMNASHRQHRQKTQKKIAEEYIQTYIDPKIRHRSRQYDIDPIDKRCQLIPLVDSEQEDDDGIKIY